MAALVEAMGRRPPSRAPEPLTPPVVDVPAPLVRQLWAQWEPFASQTMANWHLCKCHREHLLETEAVHGTRRVKFGDIPVDELSENSWALLRAALEVKPKKLGKGTLSPTYVNRMLPTLQTMFRYCVGERLIGVNPSVGWERVDEEAYARQRMLTADEFQQYISGAHPTFQGIATIQYRCVGMRPTEARELLKTEIHWPTNTIRLDPKRTKNRRTHPIPIPDDVLPVLELHCKLSRGVYVFVRPQDPTRKEAVPYGTYIEWARAARRSCGLEVGESEKLVPYHFRHAGVTQALTDGASPVFVSKAARVSPNIMNRTYAKFLTEQQESLRAALNRNPLNSGNDSDH